MARLARSPLFDRLSESRRILLSGAGGGFDLYSALPLYLCLKPQKEAVFLANLSFASLLPETGRRLTPALTQIDADTTGAEEYFPERILCRWFRGRQQEISVFCFQMTGVRLLSESYRILAEKLHLDTVVLVDGGTDSLMRGDEVSLGTPSEDLAHLAAVHKLQLPCKLLSCIGFGVDTHDGICHAQFLEAVADLQRKGGFLGAFSLLPEMEEARLYLEAVDHAVESLPGSPSVVSGSIASAIEGRFGNVHRTWRTEGNRLFINPLMSMYWSFELDRVARRCLYLRELLETETPTDVARVIREFREGWPTIKPWQSIPH